MRLLLDESVPSRLRGSLTEHSVRTVVEAGWSGKNGKLLALAASEFDAFITVDKNLPFQQNLTTLPIALFVLDSVSNIRGSGRLELRKTINWRVDPAWARSSYG
jgi:hypothetical protein